MTSYLRFRIRLHDINPPIWREFLIAASAKFKDLHYAIQDSCGWRDYHLYAFRSLDGRRLIAGVPDDDLDPEVIDPDLLTIDEFFSKPRDGCVYRYDFGDDWRFEVEFEELVEEKDVFHRRLIGGERASPIEDCGGVGAYEKCVALVRGEIESSPTLEAVADQLADWDPERFDLRKTKERFDLVERRVDRPDWLRI